MILQFSCYQNYKEKRLSAYIAEQVDIVSKRQLKKIIEDGKIFINNKKVFKDVVPVENDLIEIPLSLIVFSIGSKRVSLGQLELDVLEEHPCYLVINKPRKIHSVIIRQDDPATLADLIAEKYPETIDAGRSQLEAGLVQRLDFYTSGRIVAARSREAWEDLHEKFISGKITKEYHAFVEGRFEIDTYTDGHYIKTLEIQEKGTLVLFRTNEGARHIVRRVFSILDHPLQGDTEYGSASDNVELVLNGVVHKYQGFYLEAAKIEGL